MITITGIGAILTMVDIVLIIHIILYIPIKQENTMYYRRYLSYPYYRRFYNVNPYFYRRYYNPYYNIIDSQYSNIDQGIVNYGDMTDVYQDANVYQLRTPEPKDEHQEEPKPIEVESDEIEEEDSGSLIIIP